MSDKVIDYTKLLDKKYEDLRGKELLTAPVSALSGVSEEDGVALKSALKISTIEQLATNKSVLAAQALHAPATTQFPTGFEPSMGLLMAQCCVLTYDQYSSGRDNVNTGSLTALSGAAYSQLATLTASEALGMGSGPGAYRSVQAGFILQCTPTTGSPFYIVAIRGTQTYAEWISDATTYPTPFWLYKGTDRFYDGFVHAGFYEYYTYGTDGARSGDGSSDPYRASGSIAEQIKTWATSSAHQDFPVYVTGHSLGAAVAILCAADLRWNVSHVKHRDYYKFPVYMYNFACPRVSAGFTYGSLSYNVDTFPNYYQQTKYGPEGSYRIVNLADIVPILPPAKVGSSPYLQFKHASPTVVNFTEQTGEITSNHSMTTYLTYMQRIAP